MKSCVKFIAILLVSLLFLQSIPIMPIQVHAEDDVQAPGTPANLALVSKSQTSVSLTWSESTDDVGVTGYLVYRNGTQAGSVSTPGFEDTGLTSNTTYIYTVKASDAAGNVSAESDQLSVTTDAVPDTEVPSAPANLTLAAKTNSSVSLTWDASTDNVGIDKYEVFCDNVSAGFSTTASYTCTGLNQGTAYSFHVIAYDAAGNISVPCTAISVTTDDTQAPIAPANLRTVNRTGETISLAWDASTDNIGVAGYEVYQDSVLAGTTSSETSFVVTGLTQGTSYTFTVIAKDSANNLSEASNTLTANTMPVIPGVPDNIVTMPAATSISISWNAVPGATAYDIQFDGNTVSNITATTYIFSGLTPNTIHSFKILSTNESGPSVWSSTIDVWTLLQTPASFAVAQAKNMQTCTWNTVANAEGYDIEVDGVIYDNGTATTYVNSGLVEGSSHTYRVRAKNSNTPSDWTALITKVAIGYTAISGTISQDRTLTLEDSPYLATGNLTVAQNVTLTVMPGVVLKFNPGIKLSVLGKVNAIGDEQNKIVFTTSKDADFGGTGVVATGDYCGGYNVEATGELYGNYLSLRYGYCTGAYGYTPYNLAWSVYSVGNLNLVNSEVINSAYRGILLRGNSNVIIDNCYIFNSGVFGIDSLKDANTTGAVVITNSNITSNKNYAIHISDNGSSEYNISGNNISNNLNTAISLEFTGINKLKVNNNVISSNSGHGIYIYQYNGGILGEIRNNQINNNMSSPIFFRLGLMSDASIFNNVSGNTYSGNTRENVAVDAVCIDGAVNNDIILPNNIPEYIVYDYGITVYNGKTLTIQPGILMKFYVGYKVGTGIRVNNGKLNALGTPDKPIIFTSAKDAEFGGSGVVNVVWDFWGGVAIDSQGEFNGDYIRVKYGGINYSGRERHAFKVEGKFRLTNSEISDTAIGISYETVDPQFAPVIAFNTFKRLSFRGIYNSYYEYGYSNIIVDARYNYWDSIYGPNDRITVDAGVTTYPYLGKEFKVQFNFGGDAVNPATGNFARQYTDMTVKSPGFDLSFGRSYNSMDDRQDSLLGRGWTFSFESSVKPYSSKITYEDGTVQNYTLPSVKVVRLPDGSTQAFDVNQDGTFTGRDNRNKLAKQTDGTYILTTKDQYSYCFNTNGYIQSASDRNGNTITYDVDANGKIHGITDQVGRTFTIVYNSLGYIETITDPAGRTVTYQYENNQLARVIDPIGNVSRYVYDTEGFLSEIRDNESNLVESVVYIHQNGENLNKVDHTTDKNGNVSTYTYDNANGMTVITDSNGRQTVKSYDTSYCVTNSLEPDGKTEITEYYKDSLGNNKYWEEKSVTDRNGNKTQYLRDSNGNVTQITNPDNSIKVMTYDSKNNVLSQKDENGKYTYFIYDANGINLIKKVQPLNGTDYMLMEQVM